MEEKESTVSGSGSAGNSETESPSVPQVMKMDDANMMDMERPNLGGTQTTMVAERSGSFELLGRKKRGRPRKYDSDGNLSSSYLKLQESSAAAAAQVGLLPPPPGFALSPPPPPSSSDSKKGRGRPPGSGNWQLLASLDGKLKALKSGVFVLFGQLPPGSGNWQLLASLGELFASTAGGDFTPHVVNVNTGEDVAGKILSFSQKGPRGICILSANGAVSNVTIRQPGSSGGTLTYEGRFEILTLTGSFTIVDNGGIKSRTGGLSVSLAGPDGRVIGGGIAGLLTASSPIQIVVGSFMPNGYTIHKKKHHRNSTLSSTKTPSDTATTAPIRPISQAMPNDDEKTRRSPSYPLPEQRHEEAENGNKHVSNTTSSDSTPAAAAAVWNGLATATVNQRPYPDINMSAPGE